MALEKFRAPALPVPPNVYDQQYLTNLIRALRLYFNQLDSLTPNQAQSYRADQFIGGEFQGDFTGGSVTASSVDTTQLTADFANIKALQAQNYMGGSAVMYNVMANNFYGGYFYGDGRYLSTPYNQFTSDQDQTGAVATATAVTFNTDDFPDSISIVNNSEITFGQSGIYLLTYSLAFTNPTNDAQDIDIWYRYEGTDIANSNSKFSVPARKSTGNNSYLIAVTPYIVDIPNDGDQVQLMFRVTDASVTLEHLAAVAANPGVTPAIPATPSAILTVQFISAQFPPTKRVAPLGVVGAGGVGEVTVSIA